MMRLDVDFIIEVKKMSFPETGLINRVRLFDNKAFILSEIKSIIMVRPDLKINKSVFKDYLLRGFSFSG